MFILDFGSANSHRNDLSYAKRMIDELAKIDKNRLFCLKWQLFKKAGNNIPLNHNIFHICYNYAQQKYGYQTTASVFDKESLDFLLNNYEIPFIKIANRPDLYWLIGEIPRKIPVIVSVKNKTFFQYQADDFVHMCNNLCCVSKYPAKKKDYEDEFGKLLRIGISDHTTNWDLYNKYKPEIYECHFKLEDSTGLDAGKFARTPSMLKEIL